MFNNLKMNNMKYLKHILLTICASISLSAALAQFRAISPEDELIVCSAMKDEMKRSYDSLRKPDYENPFYISYTLLWGSQYGCTAKMGVIYANKTSPLRDATMRLMVGNYDMNDENFEPSNYSREPLPFTKSFVLPTEADYIGLRRHFWQMSEDLYRSANDMYKQKKAAVAKKGGVYQADGLQDFTPVKPFTVIESPDPVYINLDSVKNAVQRISEVFDNDTLITDASVSFVLNNVMTYYMNTEGSETHRRYTVAEIFLDVTTLDDSGTPISNSLHFTENNYKLLPDENQLISACNYLKIKTLEEKYTDTIPEDYSGPLMIIDGATADYFEDYLFSGQNALFTGRESYKEDHVKQTPKENKSDDQKYNKRIFSRDLNVMDCSRLTEFDGIKLAGHYSIDAEGVTPVDSLVLVKDGVIKNMLNNRVPTPMQRIPNGHSKINGLSTYATISPGVLVITSNTKTDRDEIKRKLLQEAEDRNLEYAYILKPNIIAGKYCGKNLIKIDVATGTEKIVKHGFYAGNMYDDAKPERILAMSGKLIVHNTYFKSLNENPTTYIVPDALLIEMTKITFEYGEDVEIKKPYVPYPPFE